MSTLLVLGTLDATWLGTVTAAATRSSLAVQLLEDAAHIPADPALEVRALVLGHLPAGSGPTAELLRQDERLEHVAVFATAVQPSTPEYVQALTSGIDD